MSQKSFWTLKLIIKVPIPQKKTNFFKVAKITACGILPTAEKHIITLAVNRLVCSQPLCAILCKSLHYHPCYSETRVWGWYNVYFWLSRQRAKKYCLLWICHIQLMSWIQLISKPQTRVNPQYYLYSKVFLSSVCYQNLTQKMSPWLHLFDGPPRSGNKIFYLSKLSKKDSYLFAPTNRKSSAERRSWWEGWPSVMWWPLMIPATSQLPFR